MIIFFSSQIFSGDGGSSGGLSPNQATALVMGVNFLATIVASGFLNIFGRKTLNFSMTAACTVFLLVQGVAADKSISTLELVMCLGFVVCFEFGPGPVVWMYMSEIMNDTGVSMGVFINWFLTLLVGLGSPSLSILLGGGNIFILFGGFQLVAAIFIFFFMKETKGLSEAKVQALYRNDPKQPDIEEVEVLLEDH